MSIEKKVTRLIRSSEWNEYKVVFPDSSTYYTDCLQDARDTIKATTGEDAPKVSKATQPQNDNW